MAHQIRVVNPDQKTRKKGVFARTAGYVRAVDGVPLPEESAAPADAALPRCGRRVPRHRAGLNAAPRHSDTPVRLLQSPRLERFCLKCSRFWQGRLPEASAAGSGNPPDLIT